MIDPPNGKVNSFIFDVINAKATQIADTVNCFADTLFSLFPTIKDAAIVKAAKNDSDFLLWLYEKQT